MNATGSPAATVATGTPVQTGGSAPGGAQTRSEGGSRASSAVDRVIALAAGAEVGERLGTKSELQELCGVSAGTFNEALRVLQERRIVSLRPGPGGGIFVSERTPMAQLGNSLLALDTQTTTVEEASRIRDALDPLLIADAVKHSSGADIADLRTILEDMRVACKKGDRLEFVRANWHLHARIADISPNTLLRCIYVNLLAAMQSHLVDVLPCQDGGLDEYIRARLDLHVRLVDAIDRRDDTAAQALAVEHATNG
ncbi:FadR/GntR family transcriptional regulator [Haematomicrobium sanguinis]|uniref:FadR/GntR family transcriptional regulator n=1 Tax=Haematomicrobium sanguinis TaxID=479106 RepID=UPI0009FD7221|nr:FCD domain-containing protein [Haematomicrobium sanguinis]